MTDIFPKNKRSEIMAKISGKESKPEIIVRKYLFTNGYRYRKNDKRFPGKPDIVLPKYKTVIFIHGCFWHGHDCKASKLPETRMDFWKEKIKGNKERDIKNKEKLQLLGWKVIIIWQCSLINKDKRQETFSELINKLTL